MRWCVLCIAFAWAVGCGGSGGGEAAAGPVQGSIVGRPFTAKGVAAANGVGTCSAPGLFENRPMAVLHIHLDAHRDLAYMTDPANACPPLYKSTESLEVDLWSHAAGASPTFAPGVYTIHQDGTGGLAVWVAHLDDACAQILPNPMADSGTLTLTESDANHVRGAMSFRFDDGSGVAGAFDAPILFSANACGFMGLGGGPGEDPVCPQPLRCTAAP